VDAAGNTPGGSGRLDEPEPQSPRLNELTRAAEDRERIAEEREALAAQRERLEDIAGDSLASEQTRVSHAEQRYVRSRESARREQAEIDREAATAARDHAGIEPDAERD
jgi:hypothetical protein